MIHFLTWLFPRRCAVCDRVLPGEGMICPDCEKIPVHITGDICMICGKPVTGGRALCRDCEKTYHYFRRNLAVFTYDSMKSSLYRFKYGGRCEYARYYAKETASCFRKEILGWQAEAIIPVPLHRTRLRKRGYNQSEVYARELGKYFPIPVENHLIYRCKKTKPMKLLSRVQRQNNLKKAFIIRQNDVKLNTVILVDDIYTTGATLDAVAEECIRAGIKNIYTITIAAGNGN